jgi:hypothetical protein
LTSALGIWVGAAGGGGAAAVAAGAEEAVAVVNDGSALSGAVVVAIIVCGDGMKCFPSSFARSMSAEVWMDKAETRMVV